MELATLLNRGRANECVYLHTSLSPSLDPPLVARLVSLRDNCLVYNDSNSCMHVEEEKLLYCYGYQMSILRWNNAKQKKKILLQGENTMKNVLKNHCEVENYVILHGLWNSAIDCIWEKARNLGNSGLRTKVCPQIGLFFPLERIKYVSFSPNLQFFLFSVLWYFAKYPVWNKLFSARNHQIQAKSKTKSMVKP